MKIIEPKKEPDTFEGKLKAYSEALKKKYNYVDYALVVTGVIITTVLLVKSPNLSKTFDVKEAWESQKASIGNLDSRFAKLKKELDNATTALHDAANRQASVEVKVAELKRDVEHSIETFNSPVAKISAALLEDKQFRKSITNEISKSSEIQFLPVKTYKEKENLIQTKISSLEGDIERFDPVFQAINPNNQENILAVPILRKDIDSFRKQLDGIEESMNGKVLEIKTQYNAQIARMINLAQWFLGIVLVALVIPLIKAYFEGSAAKKVDGDPEGE